MVGHTVSAQIGLDNPTKGVMLVPMSEPVNLRDPAVMLATLRLAYRFVLDGDGEDGDCKRLSHAQQRELGRRLAEYWNMDPKPTEEERKWAHPPEEDPFIAMVRGIANEMPRAAASAQKVIDLLRDYPRKDGV